MACVTPILGIQIKTHTTPGHTLFDTPPDEFVCTINDNVFWRCYLDWTIYYWTPPKSLHLSQDGQFPMTGGLPEIFWEQCKSRSEHVERVRYWFRNPDTLILRRNFFCVIKTWVGFL